MTEPNKKDKISFRGRFFSLSFLIFFSPIIFVFFIFFGSGFAPSPTMNAVSNWLSICICALFLVASASVIFSRTEIKVKENEPINKFALFLMAPIFVIFFSGMYASAFNSVLGSLLHDFTKQECYFVRNLTTKISPGMRASYYLNLVGSEDIPLNWHISRKEYEALPKRFTATVYASQSPFGVKMENYIPWEQSKELMEKNKYQQRCSASWVLNRAKKRDNFLFYWY